MKEDLPHVPQFIQIHVGQTDERKCQEGLAVPPDGEVGKQVTLKSKKAEKNLNSAHFVGHVFIIIVPQRAISLFSKKEISLPQCGPPFRVKRGTKGADEHFLETVKGTELLLMFV